MIQRLNQLIKKYIVSIETKEIILCEKGETEIISDEDGKKSLYMRKPWRVIKI